MTLFYLDQALEYEKMGNVIIKNKCVTTFSNQESFEHFKLYG